MSASLPTGSDESCYGGQLAIVKKLLQLALDLGRQALLHSDSEQLQISIGRVSQAYEWALSRSLLLSLTNQDCAAIDEKSHEIESLRSALERRLSYLNKTDSAEEGIPRNRDSRRTGQVRVFLDNCKHVRKSARSMRRLNAALMHS